MNTVGNNISNVNTVGYKSQRMDFQDFVYQYTGTAAGMGQIGRGTSVGIIMNDFMQGSLETTTSATDIAITGNGFFQVRPLTSNEKFYTRAGNFTFNRDGFLVDPHGYVLQGWLIDRANQGAQSSSDMRTSSGIVGIGAPTDIKLDTFTCPPRHTTNLSLPVNLANPTSAQVIAAQDHSNDPIDPFFALLKTWDATQNPPLGSRMYEHQSTIEVFDEGGRLHKLTIYFDRVVDGHQNQSISNNSAGETYWEFIVTMDPASDVRDFSSLFDPMGNEPTTPNVPPALRGLLGAGVMTFDSSGQMKNMSMFVPNDKDPTDRTMPPGGNPNRWWQNDPSGRTDSKGDPVQVVNLNNWIPAPISSDGFPMIAPGFSGSPGLQAAYAWDQVHNRYDYSRPNPNIADRMIAIDQGMRITNNQWNFPVFNLNSALITSVTNQVGGFASGAVNAYADEYTRVYNITPGDHTAKDTAAKAAALTRGLQFVENNGGPPGGVSGTPLANAVTAMGTAANAAWDALATPINDDDTKAAIAAAVAASAGMPLDAAKVYADAYVVYRTTGVPPTSPPGFPTFTGSNELAAGNFAVITYAFTQTLAALDQASTDPVLVNVRAALQVPATAGGPGLTPAQAQIYATAYAFNGGDAAKAVEAVNNAGDPPVLPLTAAQARAAQAAAATAAAAVTSDPTTALPTAAMIGANKFAVNGSGNFGERMPNATTNFGTNNFEHSGKRQDGYTFGDLRFVNVDNNGVLSATYSNGVTLQLFQIALNDFPSLQNLRREGGNLYSETRESGQPSTGAPGSGVFGTTRGYSLEQSNVDLSREFVNMITTQRGFQANSKNITTVDTMLEVVINMKR